MADRGHASRLSEENDRCILSAASSGELGAKPLPRITTLQSGDVFTPVLLANTDGVFPGNDWADGFVRGMNLRRDDWAALFNDENHGGSLVPIFALAHEHDPDPEMRPYKEAIGADQREKLIIGVAAGVMKIYKYFRTHRVPAETPFDPRNTTYRRFTRKTGRNELCPCGSGKKPRGQLPRRFLCGATV